MLYFLHLFDSFCLNKMLYYIHKFHHIQIYNLHHRKSNTIDLFLSQLQLQYVILFQLLILYIYICHMEAVGQ